VWVLDGEVVWSFGELPFQFGEVVLLLLVLSPVSEAVVLVYERFLHCGCGRRTSLRWKARARRRWLGRIGIVACGGGGEGSISIEDSDNGFWFIMYPFEVLGVGESEFWMFHCLDDVREVENRCLFPAFALSDNKRVSRPRGPFRRKISMHFRKR